MVPPLVGGTTVVVLVIEVDDLLPPHPPRTTDAMHAMTIPVFIRYCLVRSEFQNLNRSFQLGLGSPRRPPPGHARDSPVFTTAWPGTGVWTLELTKITLVVESAPVLL